MKITDILPELYNLSYFKYVYGERKYSRLSLEKTQYSYRFITVGEGRLTVSCAGRTVQMCAGDILYLLPGESYRINPSKSDFSLYSAYFDFRERMVDKAQKGQCIFMNNYDRSLCSERIAFEDAEALNQSGFFKGADRHRRLDELKHCDKGGALFPFFARACILSTVADILAADQKSKKKNSASGIVEYIRSNPEADLSVDALSAMFSYHKNHISRLIKKECGKTLVDLVREAKIDYAKSLIEVGEYSLGKISEMLGFYDYSHFYKTFSAVAGMTVTEYKRKS